MNTFATFEIIVATVVWAWVGWAWWQRRQAGPLLLEFEPNQGPSLRSALLVVMAAVAVGSLIVGVTTPGVTMEDIAQALRTSSIGALIVAPMFFKQQIRQHGVLVDSQLVRWQKITSYAWERNKSHELTLRLYTSLPFFATRRIVMPPIYRDKVEELLAQHVAGGVHVD